MEDDYEQEGSARSNVIFAVVAIVLLGSGIWWLQGLLSSEAKPAKQVVEIQVIRPPPPPPPEVEEEPPPEMEEEEVDIPEPEPEPLPDIPDMPDAPPAEQLGLDAEGVAGSDAFGLLANRGGRGLIGGEGAFRWYAQKVKDQISGYLGKQEEVLQSSYKVRVLLWLDENGRVARLRLASSSGDPEIDRLLKEKLGELKRFDEAPPPGLPQPISIRVVGHA